jgi:hypothetical protein
LLLALLWTAFAAPAVADPKTSIPAFADFAGVRVGLDTIQRLEKRLGPGRPTTGGHPHGAREWRISRPRAILYADGFNSFDRAGVSYRGERQIDSLSIIRRHERSALPLANVDADRVKFMGRVGLGTSRRHVLKSLAALLPPPESVGDDLIWKSKGFVRVSTVNNYRTTAWEARLHFQNGTLDEIQISAD